MNVLMLLLPLSVCFSIMMFSLRIMLPLLATHVTYFPLNCDCGIVMLLVVVTVLSSFCTVKVFDTYSLSSFTPDHQLITGVGLPVAKQETMVSFSLGLPGSCDIISDKPAYR